MKAIIYAGIGLFSAASVYGVVDYYNTKSKGTMEKMYAEDEPIVVPDKTTVALTATSTVEAKTTEADNKTTVATTVKKTAKKTKTFVRQIKFSDFSRGRIVPKIVIDEEIKATPPVVVEKENN